MKEDRNETYDIIHVSLAKEWFGMMLHIYLNKETFKHAHYFTAYIHETGSHRIYDSTLTNVMSRSFSSNKITDGDNIRITCYTSEVIKLPPPYDTHCSNISQKYHTKHRNVAEVMFDCINVSILNENNQVSPLGQIYDKINKSFAQCRKKQDEKHLSARAGPM